MILIVKRKQAISFSSGPHHCHYLTESRAFTARASSLLGWWKEDKCRGLGQPKMGECSSRTSDTQERMKRENVMMSLLQPFLTKLQFFSSFFFLGKSSLFYYIWEKSRDWCSRFPRLIEGALQISLVNFPYMYNLYAVHSGQSIFPELPFSFRNRVLREKGEEEGTDDFSVCWQYALHHSLSYISNVLC